MIKMIAAVLASGLMLGLSRPLVMESLGAGPLDPTGLTGLLGLVGFIPVILMMDRVRVAGAFLLGFGAAFIQYMITLYWFVIAMTVFGKVNLAISISVLALTATIMGSYIGSAFAITRFLSQRFGWRSAYVLPVAICAVDYLLNFGLVGGFPWANIGYSIASIPVLLQAASLVGIYGLVFYVVLVNTTLASLWKAINKQGIAPPVLLATTLALTAGFVSYGVYRLETFDAQALPTVRVAMLQGNIEQGIKNKSALYYNEILERYRRLQTQAMIERPDLIVWPEASLPGVVLSDVQNFKQLNLEAAPGMVIGAVVRDGRDYRNTALVLNHEMDLLGRFDKTHLVPFGEYVPWPFKGIVNKIVPGMGAFKPSNAFMPISLKLRDDLTLSVGATICYEGVFPEISREFTRRGATLLLNLTNDAWYGVSSAPYQHLRMYAVRAVENGRSYARATNTGVSGWIDPRGFIHKPTSLYENALVTAQIPISTEKTPYLLFGDWIAQASLVFLLGSWLIGLVGRNVLTRKRHVVEWTLALASFMIVILANRYFMGAEFATDESAKTKITVITAVGLVIGAGALAGKPWGRVAILITAGILAVLSGLLSYFDGVQFLPTVLISITVLILAFIRRDAYAGHHEVLAHGQRKHR